MELSRLIARVVAVIYVSASLGGFISGDYYRRIADGMLQNAALTYLMGLMTVVFGFLIVHHHNRWSKDWTVLITIIGWLALVKGVLIIVFPGLILRWSEPFLTNDALRIFPYVTLMLGLLFGYLGFARRSA